MDDAHFDQLVQHELITPEEERSLAVRIQNGERAAVDELAAANLRLLVKVAGGLATTTFPIEDCVSEGYFGLLRAAEKFNPQKFGTKFSTYAVYHIKAAILRARYEKSTTIRVSVNMQQTIAAAANGTATASECVRARKAVQARDKILSLNRFRQVQFEVEADSHELVSEIDKTDCAHYVRQLLTCLTDRERAMVELRFGFAGPPLTLEQIGKIYYLGKERVRQILVAALHKMRAITE